MRKQLTKEQEAFILEKTGADKINLLPRTILKSGVVEEKFINEIDDFVFTNGREEKYHDVGMLNEGFRIGKEKIRRAVDVTTKS